MIQELKMCVLPEDEGRGDSVLTKQHLPRKKKKFYLFLYRDIVTNHRACHKTDQGYKYPPWIFPVPKVVRLVEQKREWSERNVSNIGYLVHDYVRRNYLNYMPIFSVGSKDPASKHVGAGV